MMQVPISWKLSVDGAGNIKSVMNDLNTAFQRGQISSDEYSNSLQKVAREGQRYNNVGRYQNQIFMAMHPNINKLSRSFSTLSSVLRTVMAALTMLNTLMTANNTKTSNMMELEREMAENRREYARTEDPLRLQELDEQYQVLIARQKEMKDGEHSEFWTGLQVSIALVAATLGGVTSTLKAFGMDFSKYFVGVDLSGVMGFLGTFSSVFANPAIGTNIALFASQFLDLIPGMKEFKADFGEWLRSLGSIDMTWLDHIFDGVEISLPKVLANIGKTFSNFFTTELPVMIGTAGLILSNFFVNDLPLWATTGWNEVSKIFVSTWNKIVGFLENGINLVLSGFVKFVNMIIDGINKIIKGLNKLPNVSIPLIDQLQLDKVNLGRLPEETQNKNSGGVGTGIVNNITVMGSIMAEREVVTVLDKYTKNTFKSKGLSVN